MKKLDQLGVLLRQSPHLGFVVGEVPVVLEVRTGHLDRQLGRRVLVLVADEVVGDDLVIETQFVELEQVSRPQKKLDLVGAVVVRLVEVAHQVSRFLRRVEVNAHETEARAFGLHGGHKSCNNKEGCERSHE